MQDTAVILFHLLPWYGTCLQGRCATTNSHRTVHFIAQVRNLSVA